MAIYRPPKARWPAVIAAAVLGMGAGLIAGGLIFGESDPDPAEALRGLRSSLAEAAGTLEIVAIEYEESIEGDQIVSRPEYEGATDALARSREQYEANSAAVAIIDQAAAASIDTSYEELTSLVRERAPVEDVVSATEELSALLKDVTGPSV